MRAHDLFDRIPAELPVEQFTTIHRSDGMRIERIVSQGHASGPDFWYDQDDDEWVLVFEGSAVLAFEGDPEPVELQRGAYVYIPAHARHRVVRTDPIQKTIWLAIFTPPVAAARS